MYSGAHHAAPGRRPETPTTTVARELHWVAELVERHRRVAAWRGLTPGGGLFTARDDSAPRPDRSDAAARVA